MSVNVAAALQLGQVDPAIKSSICPNLRFQALRFSIKAGSLSNSKVFLPLPFFLKGLPSLSNSNMAFDENLSLRRAERAKIVLSATLCPGGVIRRFQSYQKRVPS